MGCEGQDWQDTNGAVRIRAVKPETSNEPVEVADAELMEQLAGGSMPALGQLVRRHQRRVRALAYRMTGRWGTADDIAQETFLRVHRAARRYRPTARFSTWLYRIVVNLCLDEAKQRRRPRLAEREIKAEGGPPEDPLVRRETLEAVRREVEQLPERQKVALILHRFENLSHGQIAEVTGWSESAVESLLVRAYAQLRDRLKNWADL
jgi:RNA polymerase sigma-70 factor (ECF subfamily)